MSSKLLMMFVPKDNGDRVTSVLRAAGAGGGTVTRGRSWSNSAFLQLFGIGETVNDIVFCVADEDKLPALRDAVVKEMEGGKKVQGCLFSIDLTRMYKSGKERVDFSPKKEDGMKSSARELIIVILNKGFADDAMAAARQAGAGGGTVLHGRGTARPEDASFFGITLVPEKEILLIITEKEKTAAILDAMAKLPCLMQPGSGIAFSMDADGFVNLGQREA